MTEKRKKSANELSARVRIKMAFDELFDAIEIQEGSQLPTEQAKELRAKCEDHQAKILAAFDAVAEEVANGDFTEEQEEEKIMGAIDSVLPLLQNINEIQATLKIADEDLTL